MSTRRSVRSRTAAPPPVAPSQTPSSTPSIASGRAERQTRSQQPASGNAQNTKRSESTEEYDGTGNKKSLRRTRATNQDDALDHTNDADEPAKLEPDAEDAGEEVTRCICGVTEYPGLVAENLDTYKQLYREGGGDDTAELVAEDIGSLFIQCDICKVWQHGGCVGIFDNALAPEEYFCELCRKDLHRLGTSSTGQRYSFYQPLRATLSMSPEPFRKPAREGRSRLGSGGLVPPLATESTMSAKKRSTMNSRDEEADIMRAIEESKKDGGISSSTLEASKSNKRSRSESDDPKSLKRQRTESESAQLKESNSSDDEQDAETQKKQTIRGAAARSQKQRELREARDTERQDAALRRAARSERRRGQSPTPSEVEETAKANSKDKAREKTPPIQPEAVTPSSRTTKKTPVGRKKGNRSGRNQYTRDKDKNQDDDDADDDRNEMDDSPIPDGKTNGDTTGRSRGNAASGLGNEAIINGGRGGTKSRHATAAANPSKLSISECRKRAQAYREFLTQDGMNDRRSALSRDAEVLQVRKTNNEPSPEWSNWTLAECQARMKSLTGKEVVSMLLEKLDAWIKEFGEPVK